MSSHRPIALTIAGSDPSGGAGIQADLKTFTALGVYGASVITALTAQNTRGVSGVMTVPAAFIERQFAAVASDLKISAAKTGMLADVATVRTVASLIRGTSIAAVVVDPVMIATSGDSLISEETAAALIKDLLPLADVLTPNLPEAARLLGRNQARSPGEMREQARALLAFGPKAVLLKGGHGTAAEATDTLVTKTGHRDYSKPKIETRNTHGTGCTLAAAVTAALAKGLTLEDAVLAAKDFVWQALHSGAQHHIGTGHGPVDHLFDIAQRNKN